MKSRLFLVIGFSLVSLVTFIRCSPLSPSISKRPNQSPTLIQTTGEEQLASEGLCQLDEKVLTSDCYDKNLLAQSKDTSKTFVISASRNAKEFEEFKGCDVTKQSSCHINLILSGFTGAGKVKEYFKFPKNRKKELDTIEQKNLKTKIYPIAQDGNSYRLEIKAETPKEKAAALLVISHLENITLVFEKEKVVEKAENAKEQEGEVLQSTQTNKTQAIKKGSASFSLESSDDGIEVYDEFFSDDFYDDTDDEVISESNIWSH